MFSKEDCSFDTYRRILRDIKSTGKYCDYADVISEDKDMFLVLRHDIEFSVDRAFKLSMIEAEEGISSSYFVQITNNAYNAFSSKNVNALQQMYRAGHHIGLHYHRGNVTDLGDLKKDIKEQAEILSKMCAVPVDRFSFHRPLREHLAANIKVEGLINTYGEQFFCLTDDPAAPLKVKYIADSNHQWKYLDLGGVNRDTFLKYDRIQLLIHPLSWSQSGAEHVENFQMIVQEKHDELVDTIESEWKIFDQLRGKL